MHCWFDFIICPYASLLQIIIVFCLSFFYFLKTCTPVHTLSILFPLCLPILKHDKRIPTLLKPRLWVAVFIIYIQQRVSASHAKHPAASLKILPKLSPRLKHYFSADMYCYNLDYLRAILKWPICASHDSTHLCQTRSWKSNNLTSHCYLGHCRETLNKLRLLKNNMKGIVYFIYLGLDFSKINWTLDLRY